MGLFAFVNLSPTLSTPRRGSYKFGTILVQDGYTTHGRNPEQIPGGRNRPQDIFSLSRET